MGEGISNHPHKSKIVMKKNLLFFTSAIIASALFFVACQDTGATEPGTIATLELPDQPFDYEGITFPAHFAGNSFVDLPRSVSNQSNPNVTNAGATLGRVLFYDPQLSINNSVSCATCHDQARAFADGLQGSVGFGGKVTPRNSMALINPSINNNLFWDSRVQSLPELILEPIQNHVEMGMEDLDILTKKLAATDYYADLFKKAYGSSDVTRHAIADAMSQFLASMKSVNSKFDQGVQSDFANFSTLEKMGMDIFNSEVAQCSGCHAGGNFSAPDGPTGEYGGGGSFNGSSRGGATNIGLDLSTVDEGRGEGNFRIPSLRNISMTAPYMHDGRFLTLEDVVEHYNSGVQSHPNLDNKFKNPDGSPKRLNLTSIEKQALVAFLHTLTDKSLAEDVRFSDPFSH